MTRCRTFSFESPAEEKTKDFNHLSDLLPAALLDRNASGNQKIASRHLASQLRASEPDLFAPPPCGVRHRARFLAAELRWRPTILLFRSTCAGTRYILLARPIDRCRHTVRAPRPSVTTRPLPQYPMQSIESIGERGRTRL